MGFDEVIKENFGKLNEKEIGILRSSFYEEKLMKNEFYTEVGKKCSKMSIVKSGLLRIYRHSDGKEVTQWISSPNYLVTEISSFFFDQPTRLSIQALTDVELFTVDKNQYIELSRNMPKWKEIETRFIAKCFELLEDRVFTHLSMNAEERYNLYFNHNKELFNKVPLQYIASVLGMSAETFSRIRKRQLNKNDIDKKNYN